MTPTLDPGLFRIASSDLEIPKMRSLTTPAGRADRMRAAAFAEVIARNAFHWAVDRFPEAPQGLRNAWSALAREEEKHLGWLLDRMEHLGQEPAERPVRPGLWERLTGARSAREFATRMAAAEERGRLAGERFQEALRRIDPISSEMFGKIAREEAAHIALAKKYF